MTDVGLVECIPQQFPEKVWPSEGCGSGKERDRGGSTHCFPGEITVHHNGTPGREGFGEIADTIGNLRAPHA